MFVILACQERGAGRLLNALFNSFPSNITTDKYDTYQNSPSYRIIRYTIYINEKRYAACL